jgi:membrane protease YdiL (CAAX protease family)
VRIKQIINKSPVTVFFILAFFISWSGVFVLIAPKLLSASTIPKTDGLLLFPVMIIGVAIAGIVMILLTEGKAGLRNFRSRLFKWKIPVRWYAIAILVPPVLILFTLVVLSIFVSASFKPNFFPFGILFGIPAGIFEEIGWTGFAVYKLTTTKSILFSGIFAGLLWGTWHLPVIDFLGAATPHGSFLFFFFLSFIALLTAMRLLMVWVYSFTNSIFIVQLMHIISTGSLVLLGPAKVTPAQETLWYALYAMLLWIVVLIFITQKIENRYAKKKIY